MTFKTIVLQSVVGLSLAVAVTSTLPWRASAQASEPLAKDQVQKLLASATSAVDHQMLTAHYRKEAARFEEKRTEHEQMLASYEKNRQQYHNKFPSMADHCRALIKNATNRRDKSAELAKMLEEMAAMKPHAERLH